MTQSIRKKQTSEKVRDALLEAAAAVVAFGAVAAVCTGIVV